MRDFVSGRTITKSDHNVWNRTLNKIVNKKDFDKWVENRVSEISSEETDEKGDIQAVHQGDRVLLGRILLIFTYCSKTVQSRKLLDLVCRKNISLRTILKREKRLKKRRKLARKQLPQPLVRL